MTGVIFEQIIDVGRIFYFLGQNTLLSSGTQGTQAGAEPSR